MKKIESFLLGKNKNQNLCEDGIYEGERIIAVIDGATSKSDRLINGVSSGCFAKNTIVSYIDEHEEELCDLPPYLFYYYINNHLRACSEEEGLTYEEYPRACMAVYNEKRHEVSEYGDCQIIIDGQLYTFEKEMDRINSEYRALILELELSAGKTVEDLMSNDTGRKCIMESLKRQNVFENTEGQYAYPVLNGISFNKKMMFTKPVEEGTEIVLATDGYPFLENTLEKSESELKRLLQEDPLCMRTYKSTKGLVTGNLSFDDRAYWRGITE